MAGGSFTYVMLTFGEFAAWVALCNQLLIEMFSSAVLARSFSTFLATLCAQPPDYFAFLGNGTSLGWSIDPLAAALVTVLTTLLTLSGRSSRVFTNVVTIVKLAVVLAAVVLAFVNGSTNNLEPFWGTDHLSDVISVGAAFIFTLTGFDSIVSAAEEVGTWVVGGESVRSESCVVLD